MTPLQYKHARESAGASAIQMAKLLGVSRKSIYRRESPGAVISKEMEIAQRWALRRVMSDCIAGVVPAKAVRVARKKRRKRRVEMPPSDDVQLHHDALQATADLLSTAPLHSPEAITALAEIINPTPDNQPTIP